MDFDTGLIDLRNPDIRMPHKGRAIVPMNNMVRQALEAARPVTAEGKPVASEHVITWRGVPIKEVRNALSKAAKRVGIATIYPHIIRHSAAVLMVEDGVPMEEVSQFLGHKDITVTRRIYARYSPNYLRSAAKALEFSE